MSSASADVFIIGVDVGGTNTDAVCLQGDHVIVSSTVPTTDDVAIAIKHALSNVITKLSLGKDVTFSHINIGTTLFFNAIIERKDLTPVAVIRLCGTASHMLEPFIDFPPDLKQVLCASIHLVNGGYQHNGDEITPLDEAELIGCIQSIRANGINNVVVCGIFSPVNPAQELKVAELFGIHHPSASVTMSHQVGQLKLLERENASILNECLKPLCARTVATFAQTLAELGLTCPFYLTQNDGTASCDQALKFPVLTFCTGPTNNMRGAAKLSGIQDGIVVNIGATATDIGLLQGGLPKKTTTKVSVGGVNNNLEMPAITSEGLGGGSCVRYTEEHGAITSLSIGPDSVGYLLDKEARIFGGPTLTASDIAVAAKMASFGDPDKLGDLSSDLVKKAVDKIHDTLEDLIDQVKMGVADVPVIFVGEGSILVDEKRGLKGASIVVKPPYYQIANAIGAASSQVSGPGNTVIGLHKVQALCNEVMTEQVSGQESPQAMAALYDSSHDVKTGDNMATPQNNAAKQAGRIISEPSPVSSSALPDPKVDPVTGEWILSEFDLECIAIGAGILGCGGGGSPHIGFLSARKTLQQGKRIRVIAPERLGSTPELSGLVVPAAYMGALGICIEKLPSGTELVGTVRCFQQMIHAGYLNKIPDSIGGIPVKRSQGVVYVDDFPKELSATASDPLHTGCNVVAVISAEVGGANCMEPLALAAMLDMPVVDCDGMGRAFPELQMYTPSIYGHSMCPSVLVDDKGRRAVTFEAETNKDLENHFRSVVTEMGCDAGIAVAPLSQSTVMQHTVHYSISRACKLGRAVLQAKREKSSPTEAILKHENGALLITGKICDVSTIISGSFTRGKLKVEGRGQYTGQQLEVEYQNENHVAKRIGTDHDQILATSPDLITIVDVDTGHAISTEDLRYGLRIAVLVLASSPLLRTQRALAVVGPRAFGYDLEFKPIAEYIPHDPIPLLP